MNRPTVGFESGHNPDTPDHLVIFHRDQFHFLWRILFLSRRNNDSARSAQGQAEQNDRDLR